MLKLEDLRVAEFSIDGVRFDFNSRPAIMGVINLSAESWYRESVCLSTERAIERGTTLHVQGAQVVDIGAESTLAHAKRIDEGAQSKQLLPIIKGLRERKILVSVETYHASVARDCLEAGANVINLTGSAGSTDIFKMAATHRAAVIICYVQGSNVREVADFDFGSDPVQLMYDYFARQIELARKCGVEKIFIDPGLGFYYRNLRGCASSAIQSAMRCRTLLNISARRCGPRNRFSRCWPRLARLTFFARTKCRKRAGCWKRWQFIRRAQKLCSPAKEHAFFFRFGNPLLTNGQGVARQEFGNHRGLVAIGKEQPNLIARLEGKLFAING